MRTTLLHLHADLDGISKEVAQVWLREEGNKESSTLVYAPSWLAHPAAYAIDPALPLREGAFQTRPGQRLFGCMADAAPDRWGRRLLAEHAGKPSIPEADILAQGQDVLRMGALRIFQPDTGEYVATGMEIPGWDQLLSLSKAALAMTQPLHAKQAVETLWRAGAAMGGANPKAMTQDKDGRLWMAKFSSASDIIDMVRWEALCLMLATRAGIQTPQFHLQSSKDNASLLLRRFDRTEKGRVGYVSGHTLVGAIDGIDYTYAQLRDAMVEHCAEPEGDIRELWKRMVFNLCISNQDDHLRNHGFLRQPEGWRLAPAFDLTPTPPRYQKPRHALAIGGEGNGRIEHAMAVAGNFEMSTSQAQQALDEIRGALADWREVAASIGIPHRQISHLAASIGVHGEA